MKVVERFLNYVKFDTMADENSSTIPSTKGQLTLANYLVEELKRIGVKDALVDEYGYVYGSIPSNMDEKCPTIGFIAHMDTSDAMSGSNVKPKIVQFDGTDIVLNEELNIKLSSKEFPELNDYIGQELIVTDGTTLLGADDKAGVAEIISVIDILINDQTIKHGDIKIAFTPDEEIGRGADKFNVDYFGADFAYTVDGGRLGELEYETFNAAGVKIEINGKSVHPGSAKDKMVNASMVALEIASQFPKNEVPERTEGYEGFYHLVSINSSTEKANMSYIIRDFDRNKFEERKQFTQKVIDEVNKKYQYQVATVNIRDQYYNMREKIEEAMYIVDYAKQAMENANVKPLIVPVRGGTDGSRLSFMGLLTPNIFTGGHNFHGKYEYIPVKSMEKAIEVILNIITIVSQK